ncbi:UNVERIFIED_CONTAM: hypothetical protein Sradi_6889800 [Sesamum radiatum]|uniref:Uncharacterized protein n=1 Tax=Sesamum radiatum TaxID=300843 RepID=A0AAW2JJG9_SESRA
MHFAVDIMFKKYFSEHSEKEKGGGTPPSRSTKGAPASSASKGKRPMSPSGGTPSEGPAKRAKAGSAGILPSSSSKPTVPSPPPPPSREEKGYLPGLLAPSGNCSPVLPFTQEEGEASFLALSLMKGVVTLEDRRLLNPLGQEDLERKADLFLLKARHGCL